MPDPNESTGSDVDAAVRQMEAVVGKAANHLEHTGELQIAKRLREALTNLKDVTQGM